MLATVELHTGRYCLMIADWVIAVEADPCREWHLDGNTWTKDTLDQVGARINETKNGRAEFAIDLLRAALLAYMEPAGETPEQIRAQAKRALLTAQQVHPSSQEGRDS